MNLDQLRAFATAVDAGSLDSAARRLHITPSAMSQRLRALESSLGTVVLQRTSPVTVTSAGEIVLRTARHMLLLEDDAHAQLAQALGAGHHIGGSHGSDAPEPVTVRVAINADSATTWLRPLFERIAALTDIRLHMEVADQSEADSLLTTGVAMAALSARKTPAPGCTSTPLGAMRYIAMARSELWEAWNCDLAAMPCVNFNSDDDLQADFLASHGITQMPPSHQVPMNHEFALAVQVGMGWGMLMEQQIADFATMEGTLVPLDGDGSFTDVPLYLHRWKLPSIHLDRVCEVITDLANESLRPL